VEGSRTTEAGTYSAAFCNAVAKRAVCRSEAPYILGKNLHLAGVHFPTWSIRADDPSRGAAPKEPRVPLPKWFWKLRAGIHPGDIDLESLERLLRSYGRWMLLAGAMLLRASQLGCDVSSEATESSGPEGCRVDAPRESDQQNQGETCCVGERIRDLAFESSSGCIFGEHGEVSSSDLERVVRSVHSGCLRAGEDLAKRVRNSQRTVSKVQMAQRADGSGLVSDWQLGNDSTTGASPPNPCQVAERYGLYSFGLGLAKDCGPAAARLFCLIETMRIYISTSQTVASSFGPHARRLLLRQSAISENQIQGSSPPVRTDRRAWHRFISRQNIRFTPEIGQVVAGQR